MGKNLVTQNMWVAAFAIMHNCKLLDVHKNGHGRIEFTFENANDLLAEYNDALTNVNFMLIRNAHQQVRTIVKQYN